MISFFVGTNSFAREVHFLFSVNSIKMVAGINYSMVVARFGCSDVLAHRRFQSSAEGTCPRGVRTLGGVGTTLGSLLNALFLWDFPHQILCGQSWGHRSAAQPF